MGWSGGSGLFRELIDVVNLEVKNPLIRKKIYEKMIKAFEGYDCDTLQECLGQDDIFDLVFLEQNPDYGS
jgi:hypothetical protein